MRYAPLQMSATPTAALSIARPRTADPAHPRRIGTFADELAEAARALGAALRPYDDYSFGLEIATRPKRTQVVRTSFEDGDRLVVRSLIGPFRRHLGPRFLLSCNSIDSLGSTCVENINIDGRSVPYLILRTVQRRPSSAGALARILSMMAWKADELERDLFGHDRE